ncbi:hypothetical protein HanPSC8_Chr16g0746651 [Helianthus annuus]|nr:hypothetical protein HanPSC8_Chr16g0746651 [Helianthus annuus]
MLLGAVGFQATRERERERSRVSCVRMILPKCAKVTNTLVVKHSKRDGPNPHLGCPLVPITKFTAQMALCD